MGSNDFSWHSLKFPTLTMYSLCFLSVFHMAVFFTPCTGNGGEYLHSYSCMRGYKLDQSGRHGNVIALHPD